MINSQLRSMLPAQREGAGILERHMASKKHFILFLRWWGGLVAVVIVLFSKMFVYDVPILFDSLEYIATKKHTWNKIKIIYWIRFYACFTCWLLVVIVYVECIQGEVARLSGIELAMC